MPEAAPAQLAPSAGVEFARDLVVRPILRDEVGRFNELLDAHHWLGHRLVGEVLRYVATVAGRWVALVGFGSAALSWPPREAWVGWSAEQQFRRLRYVVNNQRFAVLERWPNLDAVVLARVLRRVSGDYQTAYGHRVLVVETFTDPARQRGSRYAATGFSPLGTSVGTALGYRRSAGREVHHGSPRLLWVRPLRSDATQLLAAPFDDPALAAPTRTVMVDLNQAQLAGDGGLLTRLEGMSDPRKPRGVRHRVAAVLAVATCAVVSGARSFAAIGQFSADLSQQALAQLGARYHPVRRCYLPPHEATIRRTVQAVDVDELDRVVSAWLAAQVAAGNAARSPGGAAAVDGNGEGHQLQLLSAVVHRERGAPAQREVPNTRGIDRRAYKTVVSRNHGM